MRVPRHWLTTGTLAVLAACADQAPTAPIARTEPTTALTELADPTLSVARLERSFTVTRPADGPWEQIIQGTHGRGALYAVYVPRANARNRDVVFYAHGIRDVVEPISLRDQDSFYAIRDELGRQGYTVAYSSYAENGFAVKDGALRTLELWPIVSYHLRRPPRRSFLMGHSLGAGISLQLAEAFPKLYDGALLLCGMVGGSRLQTQYIGNVRALFDLFYPAVDLPGDVVTRPSTALTPDQVGAIVVPAISANPAGMLAIASTVEAPLPVVMSTTPGVTQGSLATSLVSALTFHVRGIGNILDITGERTPFDNTAGYSVGTPLFAQAPQMIAAANATISRYVMDPWVERYFERHFEPTGRLRVPVLTVHNRWDPVVPLFHEDALRRAAQAAGATHNLRQQIIEFRGFRADRAHCDIRPGEALAAFTELANWVPLNLDDDED